MRETSSTCGSKCCFVRGLRQALVYQVEMLPLGVCLLMSHQEATAYMFSSCEQSASPDSSSLVNSIAKHNSQDRFLLGTAPGKLLLQECK